MPTAIVVTFDSEGWIRRCLTALASVPAIVVDNASRDRTAAIVAAEYPHARLVRRRTNDGFAVAVNEGCRLAHSADILLVNPDAVAQVQAVETLARYMADHPRVGIVVPRLLNPDGSFQQNARTFPTPWTMLARRTFLGRLPILRSLAARHVLSGRIPDRAQPIQSAIGAVMLVRRAAIDQVGPMDERIFLYGEDWDWCYRMWKSGWEVHIQPASVMEHEYERKSGRTFDFRSPAVRHHWASALKLSAIHPGLIVGRMPKAARAAGRQTVAD
ncbi:MAG: glycosyltransferase family 2 protein [Chloroflexi bacterium]|nr:glycosyltransferase family 2 protein [Chloroflexota bacterium]